jgi:hypothetical protein
MLFLNERTVACGSHWCKLNALVSDLKNIQNFLLSFAIKRTSVKVKLLPLKLGRPYTGLHEVA